MARPCPRRRTTKSRMGESLLEVGHPDWTQGEWNTRWPLNKHSNAYGASLVVKTGPGKLYGFSVFSSNIATQYILLFDAAEVPTNGAIPVFPFPVATLTAFLAGYADVGRAFNTGCVLVNSTTANSLTIGAS